MASLLFLAGATAAVFVTGREDVLAMAAASCGAGLGLLIGRSAAKPGWWPLGLSLLFVAATAASLTNVDPAALPDWRVQAPSGVGLSSSFAAMPTHLLFWWLALCATVVSAWFLLSCPLDTAQLRIFLHFVGAIAALYAVTSIVQAQTDWEYPFSGGANFGLLPNRNHTATLLVAGSIVSFGLMQWEVTRGHRLGAVMAALCGAPSLAALLFFSTSRAGVLFLAVGFVLWAIGACGTVVKRRTVLAAVGILAAFLLVLFVAGGSAVRDRLAKLWQDVMATEVVEGDSQDVDFRQPVFRDTVSMIVDAPLTGQGMGHFEFVFPHYRKESLSFSRVLHPESDWLMVAAESGIPAVLALLGLVVWYFVRCWKGRTQSGGLLRWTAASAVGATLAHGIIDVPWHRPALGWFLLVLAVVSVPPKGEALAWPRVWRAGGIFFGSILLIAGVYLCWPRSKEFPPLVYRWDAYASELGRLAQERRFAQGEEVSARAISDFPLHYQAYYWHSGFLRTFAGTDQAIEANMAAGRFVEPVLPRVAAEQAQVWEGISDSAEADARAEAIRRAGLIDAKNGQTKSALGELEASLQAARERPEVQVALRRLIENDPQLLAHWINHASASLVDEYLSGLGPKAGGFIDLLPLVERRQLLDRWIALPSGAAAFDYMESRNSPPPGPYWRQLAKYHARSGDKVKAVGVVAEALGIPQDGSVPAGELARQMEELSAEGNDVAVRRLVRETVEAPEPDYDGLKVAIAWYISAGDWEMAWRGASRLALDPKLGQ